MLKNINNICQNKEGQIGCYLEKGGKDNGRFILNMILLLF